MFLGVPKSNKNRRESADIIIYATIYKQLIFRVKMVQLSRFLTDLSNNQ